MSTLYLCGSMTHDEHHEEKFAYWADQFRKAGWKVVSPVELSAQHHPKDRTEAMRVDIPALMKCDAIFCIEGWEQSRCARCEWSIAECLGLTILYSNHADESEGNE